MKNKKLAGALVATAVAGLFISGKVLAEESKSDTKAAKVHCEGGNECKGKGECKGVDHGCGGKNGCKGKGFMMMTQAECDAAKAKMKK
ncbi:MAG: hypothetical protein HYS22_04410 [Deltaproteobacteria bacterium]|nr:hypothetical protein [Deltaproteobacteria bacterium]